MGVFDSRENVKRYEEWFRKNPEVFESEVNAIREVLPEGIGFEIGIGTGLFAQRLGISMGNDVSEPMLESAKEKGLRVYRCSGENLPFHERCFDFVVMITTICFLNRPEEVLKESFRVLKKNGRIIIGFIPSESAIGKRYSNRKSASSFYSEAGFFSVSEMYGILADQGFSVVGSRQVLFGGIEDIDASQLPEKGCDKGSFVVLSALKKGEGQYYGG